jgi:hypothetical protein
MDTQKHDERAYKETTDKDHIEEVFPKGPLGPILGAPKQYEPLARAARAPGAVIGLIRMVKFLMTRAIRIKPCIDGHLFVVDIPSVVSQSGQAAFPSLPYSQKGRRDPGHNGP